MHPKVRYAIMRGTACRPSGFWQATLLLAGGRFSGLRVRGAAADLRAVNGENRTKAIIRAPIPYHWVRHSLSLLKYQRVAAGIIDVNFASTPSLIQRALVDGRVRSSGNRKTASPE